ncbi:hypothetical protein PENTCL1PPCAC_4843, partial [Pristionchus entomophagus]
MSSRSSLLGGIQKVVDGVPGTVASEYGSVARSIDQASEGMEGARESECSWSSSGITSTTIGNGDRWGLDSGGPRACWINILEGAWSASRQRVPRASEARRTRCSASLTFSALFSSSSRQLLHRLHNQLRNKCGAAHTQMTTAQPKRMAIPNRNMFFVSLAPSSTSAIWWCGVE